MDYNISASDGSNITYEQVAGFCRRYQIYAADHVRIRRGEGPKLEQPGGVASFKAALSEKAKEIFEANGFVAIPA